MPETPDPHHDATNWWAYGPDSPNYLARYGGPSRVAALLQSLGYGGGRDVTRQAAYSLWKHRCGNGFPDRVRVEVPNGWRLLFDLDEVRAWADTHIDTGEEPVSE